MKTRNILALAFLLALGAAASRIGGAQVRLMPSPVTVTTRDSTIIYSELSLPADTSATDCPLVVLLHMMGKDRTSYQNFVPLLTARNMAVLNVDLRGHGQSAYVRRQTRRPQELEFGDFQLMSGDLLQLLAALKDKTPRINTSRLGIVGASIGSSVGIIYASTNPEVKAVVMISPGLEYMHLNAAASMARYSRRPVLLMTGKYDMYSYQSAQALDSAAAGERTLKIYDTSKHGTDLFKAAPGADSLIVEWLVTNLQKPDSTSP